MRRTQELVIKKGVPVVIDTPGGFIEIELVGSRKLKLDLPGDIVAHRGMDRAVASSRFIQKDDEGRLVPAYRVLVPETDDQGALVGVKRPPVVRMETAHAD